LIALALASFIKRRVCDVLFSLALMPVASTSHEEIYKRSYAVLEAARKSAAKAKGYDSALWRDQLSKNFCDHVGFDPYPWQLDATESILLALDTIVIAGIGSGKTMPFVMPLLADKGKMAIVISPLKILQDKHVPIIFVRGHSGSPYTASALPTPLPVNFSPAAHFRGLLD